MLQKTTAQKKISKLRKRFRIVQGGTSASKTFSIIPMLIHYAISTPRSEISIVSETYPHLRRGAFRDFQKIMVWSGNWNDKNMNRSTMIYTFGNGSYIEFFSADDPAKIMGARRDVLFINECNRLPFETFNQLAVRTRKFIYLDYNPTSEFWVHEELKDDEDAGFIVLTYKDNEALEESLVKEIEKAKERAKTSKYWENWWRVFGLGIVGEIDGLLFTNWKQIDKIPEEAKLLGYGMDFGYVKDPTTITMVYKWNGKHLYDEICYETGLGAKDIVERLKRGNVSKAALGVADSSDQRLIDDLNKNFGYNIQPCKKGQGSVMYGVKLLQEEEFMVTKNSINFIEELRNYCEDTDKYGKPTGQPIDAYNHCIDGIRYFETLKRLKYSGRKRIRTYG